MNLESVEKIAQAVLYEGYLLYPYRQSALKNQQRWTFGGVYPREYSEATGGNDPWLMQTQCLVVGNDETRLEVKIRFLHVVQRSVAERAGNGFQEVQELRVGDEVYRPWEEAVERHIIPNRERPLSLADLKDHVTRVAIDVPPGRTREVLTDDVEEVSGTLVREWSHLAGSVTIHAEQLDIDPLSHRLTVRITNTTPLRGLAQSKERPTFDRKAVIRHTLVSTHTVMRAIGGEFVSLLEPPEPYVKAAENCQNIKTWPVLVGNDGEKEMVLSSPIILYDYPQISPETPGDLFDATEIDELLRLSVMTLTDDEKREMREGDPRGREILERTEALTPEQLMNLHGAVRGLQSRKREEP